MPVTSYGYLRPHANLFSRSFRLTQIIRDPWASTEDVIKRSRMLVEGRADLEIVQQDRLLIPSSIEGNFDLMHTELLPLSTRLVELSGGLEYDFDALRQAWQAWGQNPGAYTQVGLDLIELAYDP